jgi:hypothetical protein
MSVHVKDGTAVSGPSLCDSCSHSHVAKGYRQSEMLVVCRVTSPEYRVDFPVRECSSYIDRTRQSLYELEKIAWIVAPRGPKRRAGFVSPEGRRKTEEEIELILTPDE